MANEKGPNIKKKANQRTALPDQCLADVRPPKEEVKV